PPSTTLAPSGQGLPGETVTTPFGRRAPAGTDRGDLRALCSLGDGEPEALDRRVGDLARLPERAVGRFLEVVPRAVRGAAEARHNAACVLLVSAQDLQLRSRILAKLAHPVAGVGFDLAFRATQRKLDLFHRSRELADPLPDVDPTGVGRSRSLPTSIRHR